MKLRMAPNSVFAILLRKPWWVSLLVASAIALVSAALLPDHLKAVGAVGGALPLLVVSAIALRRQWNAPSERQIEAVVSAARGMAWPEFSRWLERGFAREGYSVQRLDGAIDFLLERQGRQTAVAARRWKAARQGEDAVQALQAAARARDIDRCLLVALGDVTPAARRLAGQEGVGLMEAEGLAQLLRAVPSQGD